METKPIVTSHGNQSLFSSLHKLLLQGLPREPCEWRRSYGRPPKTVELEASFVPFDEDILPSDTDKTLVSRPYFHIFWTDCVHAVLITLLPDDIKFHMMKDLEGYKQVVREEMADWHSALKNKSNPDWLIVVVINDESKTKSKLLPRSSVIDKVKNDFCSKQPDRCIVLNEPFKLDQKSSESWTNFLQRLRGHMLQAFNRHLNKYEENMRSLREKRNEPGWDFINFFLVQEELAFMFEMLGLYDDALIQYDELDALFTQFVISQKAQDKATGWLSQFSGQCNSWAGLSLRKSINHEKRDQIKCHKVSLLEFRNYMFSRYSALLFLLKRPWEVGQRAISFLHNTIQEVHNLKIYMPDGALDCWVFLSCLEILQTCERYLEPSEPSAYSISQANLWDYTRRKLYRIGEKCGLMPESTPTSEQLTLVIDLTSGMGIADDAEDVAYDQKLGIQRPRDKLREALSSQESFQKIYLEFSELTMGTFKHIGRFRSARLIGRDLANHYMRSNEPAKAENFLLDALKSYQREGWKTLADGTRLDMVKCQKLMPNKIKFLQTCCHVISSCSLSSEVRKSHVEMFNDIAESPDCSFLLKCSLLFSVLEVTVITPKVVTDQYVEVEMIISSHAPCDITCTTLAISLCEMPNTVFIPGLQKRKVYKQLSDGSTLREPVANFTPVAKQTPSMINVQAHHEGPSNSLNTCGIVCINTHELLRRVDSSGKGTKKSELLLEKDDFTDCLMCEDLIICPGQNKLRFTNKMSKEGRYKLSQLSVQIGGVNLLQWLDMDQHFWVRHEGPSCSVQPVEGDYLLAGVMQTLTLTIHPGSFVLATECKITISVSPGLTLEEDGEVDNVLELAIREEGDGPCLTVTDLNDDGSVTFTLKAFHVIPESEDIDAKVTVSCEVFTSPVTCSVEFVSPFTVSQKLHTSGNRKFLQMLLQNNCDSSIDLSEPHLSLQNQDTKVVSLNNQAQKLATFPVVGQGFDPQSHHSKDIKIVASLLTAQHQEDRTKTGVCWYHYNGLDGVLVSDCGKMLHENEEVSYLWRVESSINQTTSLSAAFGVTYQCDCDLDGKDRSYVYNFNIDNVKTQYIVKVSVNTQPDNSCVVGTKSCLKVTVQTAAEFMEDQPVVFYKLVKDSSEWSPGAKVSGLIDLRDKQFAEVELEVMPLSHGMLSLPKIQIYRCLDDVWLLQNDQSKGIDNTPDPASIKTVPFTPGQVYYASTGHCVNVQTVASA